MKFSPDLVIFDVDGVLVEVRESFHRSIIDTIHFFTGRRVTHAEIQLWKNRSGYNDDWRLTTDWLAALGVEISYEAVKRQFMKFYWGEGGRRGNVARERWLVTPARLRRWASVADLALFTGRTRRELRHTLQRQDARRFFRRVVTMDDVRRCKPDPEGLRTLLRGAAPASALYLGDSIDDALAARRARVPFLGVLPRGSQARRVRGRKLRELGALKILDNVNELEEFWR